jgi:hypothetical protein
VDAMITTPKLNRRAFIVGSAAVGGVDHPS